MKKYKVTSGVSSGEVYAENPSDAWAKFCEGNPDILRHPKASEREVEEVVAEEAVALLATDTAPEIASNQSE